MLLWILPPGTLPGSQGDYWVEKICTYFYASGRGKRDLSILKYARAYHFPTSSTSVVHLLLSELLIVAILIAVQQCGIVVLNCILWVTNIMEHLLIYLLATHVFSCYSGCSHLLPIFCLGYLFSVIYIFWISSSLLDLWFKVCLRTLCLTQRNSIENLFLFVCFLLRVLQLDLLQIVIQSILN